MDNTIKILTDLSHAGFFNYTIDEMLEHIRENSQDGGPDSRLPKSYAEIEYNDFENAEAIDGARFDDLNYLRYMER